MSSAITAALEAAKAKAAEATVAAASAVPATIPSGGGGAVATMAPTRRLTMDDVQPNLSVDAFIKADLRGLKINDKLVAEEGIVASIVLSEVNATRMVKYTQAGVPVYHRTYDGVTESGTGKPWGDVVALARTRDEKCRGDYPSTEIPMTLVEDAKTAKGEVVAEAGTTVGYGTSTTGHALFMKAYNAARANGAVEMVVRVKAGVKSHKTYGDYAVVEWDLLG